jgi:hypothetical protein
VKSDAICVIAALALSSAAAAKLEFARIPIPVPPGHVVKAVAMNQRNQVLVAECDTATAAQCTAFLWIPGKEEARTLLSYQPGSYDQFVLDDLGQVAALRLQRPTSSVNTVALWSDRDGWRDVGQIAAPPSNPPANFTVNDSNKHGILAGTLALQLPSCSYRTEVRHAARWEPRIGIQDLDPRTSPSNLCLNESVGLATNLHGDVAGILYGPVGQDQHPFLWTEKEGLHDLGQTFGRQGGRILLNDKRDLAGWWIVATAGIRSWFWSQSTGFRDIGYLEAVPGASWSTYADDLNKHGEVVGRSGNHAFFWSEKTGIVDLGPGAALQVSDRGLIRGLAETGSGSATQPCVWILR